MIKKGEFRNCLQNMVDLVFANEQIEQYSKKGSWDEVEAGMNRFEKSTRSLSKCVSTKTRDALLNHLRNVRVGVATRDKARIQSETSFLLYFFGENYSKQYGFGPIDDIAEYCEIGGS